MLLEILTSNIQAVLIFSTVFLVVLWILRRKKNANLPTGPLSVPVLGSLLSLPGKTMEESVSKMASKYGDIFLMYFFSSPIIVLSGHDTIKEALVKRGDVFSARANSFLNEYITQYHGLVNASGRRWKEQRRFTISALRDFGMGKHSMEGKIIEEVKVLLAEFNKEDGTVFDPLPILGKCVSNIIHSIVFGERRALDDPQFERFLQYFRSNVEHLMKALIIQEFPWLRFIPGDPFHFHSIMGRVAEVDVYIKQHIDEHKTTYDPDNITDFIYAFLKEQKENSTKKDSTFTDYQLQKLVGDLFLAGSETSATTLQWALYYLILNPDVQIKLQEEIGEVVGCSRLPSITDRPNMPYTEACIMEIQRLGNIVPLSAPHATSEEVSFRGYTLPKGIMVMTNLTSVLCDPKLFKTPDKFNPNNFLRDGKLQRLEEWIPFSLGRRQCPGESLAKMEIFLFLTAIFQQFTIKPPRGETIPESKRYDGVVVAPPKFKMCAMKR